MRSILFPKPVDFKFTQDSYKFIACLALIAFVGMAYTLTLMVSSNFGVFNLFTFYCFQFLKVSYFWLSDFSVYLQIYYWVPGRYTQIMRGETAKHVLVRTLDLVTIIIPPALPAAMTVGVVFAQKRLRHRLVYCISPRSINLCGAINVFCFDKTGTLTEDGLDMWGVVPVREQK